MEWGEKIYILKDLPSKFPDRLRPENEPGRKVKAAPGCAGSDGREGQSAAAGAAGAAVGPPSQPIAQIQLRERRRNERSVASFMGDCVPRIERVARGDF